MRPDNSIFLLPTQLNTNSVSSSFLLSSKKTLYISMPQAHASANSFLPSKRKSRFFSRFFLSDSDAASITAGL